MVFFLSEFSFTDTGDSQDSRGSEGTVFYCTLPLPPAHKHSGIYFQLCMWDDYHIILIASLVFTRLLVDEIYHLIELPFDWLMMLQQFETGNRWIRTRIDYQLVLQANRLTKCVSNKCSYYYARDIYSF